MIPEHARSTQLEGTFFPLWDLSKALSWANIRADVRLVVATDHQDVAEAIEIYPPQANEPRWCIWRDPRGILHLDDWQASKFDRRFVTLTLALEFVSLALAALPNSQSTRPGP